MSNYERIYTRIIRDHLILKKNSNDLNEFLNEIDKLVEEIKSCIQNNRTSLKVSQYRRLGSSAINLQIALFQFLDIQKTIQVPPPLIKLERDEEIYSDIDFDDSIRRVAYYNNLLSWHNAELSIISGFFEDGVSFSRRIEPESYYRFEKIWLKEIKEYKAYLIWKNEGGALTGGSHLSDYYAACTRIRLMLVWPDKGRMSEFKKIKNYIENNYLSNGKIDDGKIDEKKEGTKELIRRKAQRIWETSGHNDNEEKTLINWNRAKKYVEMFYENIIPAVMTNDESNYENVKMILRAFEFSKRHENRYLIINCFEALLATNFLNPVIIEKIWHEEDIPWVDTL